MKFGTRSSPIDSMLRRPTAPSEALDARSMLCLARRWERLAEMGANPFSVALILLGLLGLSVVLLLRRPAGLFTSRRARLPRHLDLEPLEGSVPFDARTPMEYLSERLGHLGFESAGPPVRVRAFDRTGHRLLVVPFVHRDERAYFLMGIESGVSPRSELMLHIITPLEGQRRVETTTLPMLQEMRSPEAVEARVVLDADSVDEIWSRHRRALVEHERRERAAVGAAQWPQVAAEAYEAWLQAAVRAQRLILEPSRDRYRVRPRPKSVV